VCSSDLDHRIDCLGLRDGLRAGHVAGAPELIVREIFSDCEAGAEPPLGNLYGLPVYVSDAIVENELIAFNAGTHDCAIEMRYADFARLTQARVMSFSVEAAN
jgi:Ala-tRNA(Pro) deacylase